MVAPVSGYVYEIHVSLGQAVESRLFTWMEIVEPEEQFTNLMEYNARDRDGDGIIDGRSTDPLNPDTDGDGLIDGIEVMGWEILVVNNGVIRTWVTSDPGLFDTDEDGLSDYSEFASVCTGGSNASNPDTDGDGIPDTKDRCPEEAGPEELQGCPDTDGDGVSNIDDACPDQAGSAEMNGCPDSD